MTEKTVRGRFVWHELMTPDTAASQAFYTKVLGWKTQPFEHDPSYSMFVAGTGPLGGAVSQSEGAPHWLHYIGTPDIEATIRQARDSGATVVKEPAQIPNGGDVCSVEGSSGRGFCTLFTGRGGWSGETTKARGIFVARTGDDRCQRCVGLLYLRVWLGTQRRT